MSPKIAILVLSLVLLQNVFCDETIQLRNEFMKEVINVDAIQAKIEDALGDTEDGTLIKLKMLDASSKIPTGILAGNFYDLGHFDECYGIEQGDIYGKYCLGTLDLSSIPLKFAGIFPQNATLSTRNLQIPEEVVPQPRALGSSGAGLTFAFCVASNVPASEISGIVKYTEEFCYSKATEPALSTGAIVTITILAIVLFISVASTIFDIFLNYVNKESPHELLLAFSLLTNGRKIFKSTKNPDQLLCLNGIKALSMMWVVIGHEYSLAMGAPLSNFLKILDWQKDPANMFIMGATVSVDTFFVVGGLVTVYTFLKSMDKGVKFNILLYYIHRYLRLTPALAIVIVVYVYLLNYLGNGPLWMTIDTSFVQSCRTDWWNTVLYVSNYVSDSTCVAQTWYLSVDMQLFILSPLILIPLWKWPKVGLSLLGVLTIAGCVIPFAIGYSNHLSPAMLSSNGNMIDFGKKYYVATHARFGPYVIGMALGYFLFQIKKQGLRIRLQPIVVVLTWLVFLTGLTACVYAGYPLNVATEEDRWGNSMFLAFNRPAWAVAVAGVIFLCVAGYGGPIDTFLSLPVFQFLTKLSYSMYLVHYAVIGVRYASARNNINFSNFGMMHVFWGDFMLTLALSLVLCLTFESPIIILEKYIFGQGKPKQVEKKSPV